MQSRFIGFLSRFDLSPARQFLLVGLSLLISITLAPQPQPLHAAVAAPILVSPADTITTTVDNYPPLGIPDFVWTSVGGTINYRLQASSDIGFSSIAFEAVTPNTQYTPISAGPFSDGTWYWHVRV